MFRQLQETGKWQGEIWNRRKSGEIYPVWQCISTTTDAAGQVSGYISLFSDITHLKQSEAQLIHLAYHDPLTGLPNRLLFDERLGHAIEQARRREEKLAVLFFDLDNFKPVNDQLGHQMGDELLESVARRLSARLRRSDTLSRRGGDEFTVLVENIEGLLDAIEIAVDINQQLHLPFRLSNQQEVISACSVGIALYPDHGQTAEDLLKHADAAMYAAKQGGRGRHCVYAPERDQTAGG
jgi:diguanylate cyclase (GGDEF)-like protein